MKNKSGSQIYLLVCKFNVCFIRLENVVYQNNPFIIIQYRPIINTAWTLNQLNIKKQVFLNIYHFPWTFLKYDSFIESIFECCLSCSFLVWAQNFSTIQWIVNFNRPGLGFKVCSYHLNIRQEQLNIALTM